MAAHRGPLARSGPLSRQSSGFGGAHCGSPGTRSGRGTTDGGRSVCVSTSGSRRAAGRRHGLRMGLTRSGGRPAQHPPRLRSPVRALPYSVCLALLNDAEPISTVNSKPGGIRVATLSEWPWATGAPPHGAASPDRFHVADSAGSSRDGRCVWAFRATAAASPSPDDPGQGKRRRLRGRALVLLQEISATRPQSPAVAAVCSPGFTERGIGTAQAISNTQGRGRRQRTCTTFHSGTSGSCWSRSRGSHSCRTGARCYLRFRRTRRG